MKLIIFGSTGRTGLQLVTQALEKGHEVTAFARSPEKINLEHTNLIKLKGNALDYDSVVTALQGQDAVLCALGMPDILDKSQLRAKATKNIIAGMEKSNIKRFICLSSLGAGDSYEILPFHYKYIIAPILMRNLFIDHNLQEEHIQKSKLDWTIVRAGNLTDGEYTGIYQKDFKTINKTVAIKISRADTADFMLRQLLDNKYLHKTPCISY